MKIFNKKSNGFIPADAIYIGRGSPLGNPFVIGVDGTREEVIEKCEQYLNKAIDQRDPVVIMGLTQLNEDSNLLCYCEPAPCHGRVVEKLWRERIQPKVVERSIYYAGIGARKTPASALRIMTGLAMRLNELGFVLRSGGADGADSAFARGAADKENYLPWQGFNGITSEYFEPSLGAMRLASFLHPGWARLGDPVKKLMARNGHQVLGKDLVSPVDLVICWTPDGAEKSSQRSKMTGGTGQAIDLADRMGIPVFNLYHNNAVQRLTERVKSNPLYQAHLDIKSALAM